MVDFNIRQQVQTPSGTLGASVVESAAAFTEVNEVVADATTDVQLNIAIDVSEAKAVYILSDRNLTLESNNASSPANTLALVANVPYLWSEKLGGSLVFTTDVTALFVTNASGGAAQLRIRVLQDPTPA